MRRTPRNGAAVLGGTGAFWFPSRRTGWPQQAGSASSNGSERRPESNVQGPRFSQMDLEHRQCKAPRGRPAWKQPLQRRADPGCPSRKLIAGSGREWYKSCVTANTITIRLRRPKTEIEAVAKPNVNAWVNKLIEQALGPQRVDWNQHFDRKSKQRRFRYCSDAVRREER